jgi:hypothetical protein
VSPQGYCGGVDLQLVLVSSTEQAGKPWRIHQYMWHQFSAALWLKKYKQILDAMKLRALPRRAQHCLRAFYPLILFALTLAGCRPVPEQSEGVELVTPAPAAAMTFELRFDQVMARSSQIGVPNTNSPLLIAPPLPGTFTWLSPRSGVFTPAEPLALDTRYELTLRPRLENADGQPSGVHLRRFIQTPPFDLAAWLPQHPSTNAPCEPEIKLIFNAEIRVRDAEPYLGFRDADGRHAAAEVRQGTLEERPWSYQFGGEVSLRFPQRSGVARVERTRAAG